MVLLLSSENIFFCVKSVCHVGIYTKMVVSCVSSELESLRFGIGTKPWCGSGTGFNHILESHHHFLESHDEDLNDYEKPR